MDRAAITQTIREILAESYCIDQSEISLSDRIFIDLPDDSLGLLVTGFQIEKRTKIKFRIPEIFDLKPYLDGQNRVSLEGLARLKQNYPFLNFQSLPAEVKANSFWQELLTVDALIELVWRLIIEQRFATHPVKAPRPQRT